MRVIRPAEPGKWEREDACSVCGTRAGLGVDDLATLDDQREGRRFCWTCPTCNAREWIDGDAIPRVLHVFIKTWVPLSSRYSRSTMRISKAEDEWRERFAGAPPELLSYVSARGLMIAALRYYHAARDRLEEATSVACRERATDLPVRAAIDAATRAALRKVDEEDEALRKKNKPPRAGLDRRNAFLSARTRILRDHRHAVQRSRVDELRALLSLEEARLDFARCADVVTDLAQLIAWRQDAWRRYTAEVERQAERYGVPVRHYVPSEGTTQ